MRGAAGAAFLALAVGAGVGAAEKEAALPATGELPPALAPFDALMREFTGEHRIPGAALAVVKDGRLVLARGYGYADLEKNEVVEPRALFRIASISKPITAVAVMQLAQEGRLKLETTIADALAGAPYAPREACDARLAHVTILQLLRHTGGFDRGSSFDPMFRSVAIARALGVASPACAEDVVKYMWGRPLDFAPGEKHAYSNFGYCLLGRAIERASGMTYETYVKEKVLAPLGITAMRIGKTLREGRVPGEVVYYDASKGRAVVGNVGAEVPEPYGAWYMEAMDAHGGWIASAVDLARFAADIDRPQGSRLLGAETVARMFARPEGNAGYEKDGRPRDSYYACGWSVRPIGASGKANRWHTGSLPGTSTLIVLRHDGLAWVVLFNTRASAAGKKEPAALIDPLLHKAADAVRAWPEGDLFEKLR